MNMARDRAEIGMARVGIFVDCSSLWHGAYGFAQEKGVDRPRVDYAKLMEKMRGGRALAGATAFITARHGVDVGGFQNALRFMGYDVVVVEQTHTCRTAWRALGEAMADAKCDVLAIATQDAVIFSDLLRLAESGMHVDLYAFAPHAFPGDTTVRVEELGASVLLARQARAASHD